MKKICKYCGKEFYPVHCNQKFCDECKNPKVVKCATCKKTFTLSKIQMNGFLNGQTKFFCSVKCRNTIQHKKVCAGCGKEFLGHISQKYCNACRNITHTCDNCGKIFILSEAQLWNLHNAKQTKFYCSRSCAILAEDTQQKIKATNIKKFGVERASQNPNILQKFKNNYKKKTGYDNPSKNPEVQKKRQSTFNNKYKGHPMYNSKIKEKIKITNLKKYGVEYVAQAEEVKEKIRKAYKEKTGYENPSQNPEVHKKKQLTRRQNGNRSQEEILFEQMLINLGFKEGEDFVSEYYDKKNYPFNCDFYFPKWELYVELNIYWSHGKHFFIKNSSQDQKVLEEWKEKAKSSEHYKNVLETWTIRDPLKRETAKKNKLNYVVLWTQQDILDWFEAGMPGGRDWEEEYSWKKS